jgi:hypothetical protein
MPMLQPISKGASRRKVAVIKPYPAPHRGWNARDALGDMKDGDALVLDNMLSTHEGGVLRKGYADHVTGITGAVTSLMEYNAPSGAPKLFAANATAIYDATTAGAVGAAAVSSLTSGWWQHTMFATAGGNFLVICNGADSVRNYDGSSWSTPSITNVSSANLVNVMAHQSRLWFVQVDSMKVWYLPTLSIAGAATAIDFGSLSDRGGKLVASAGWTRDGGNGMDDVACFITSKGQVHLYSGTDPSSADTWAKIGTFNIPEPIGYRCVCKVGADLAVITKAGLVPLSAILSLAEGAQPSASVTDKIRRAFASASAGSELLGWQVIQAPTNEELLIVNVPLVQETTQVQFVAHHGKWCRFTGLNANQWALKGSELFFAANDGKVKKYTGTLDDGEAISALCVSAFDDFGTPNTKTFKRIYPQFFGPSTYRPRVGMRFDYSDTNIDFAADAVLEGEGTAWDVGEWDVAEWAPGAQPNAWWQSTVGEGFMAAVIASFSSEEPITYNGGKVMFVVGNAL